MDFSSVPRALDSLRRRQPALPDDVLEIVDQLKAEDSSDYYDGICKLLSVSSSTSSDRWEPLAVGLYVATELLTAQQQKNDDDSNNKKEEKDTSTTVYMDGPRVPSTSAAAVATTASSQVVVALPTLNPQQIQSLCELLHSCCMEHLEHKEPRVRTLVAKAVGAYCRASEKSQFTREIHSKLVTSIHQHIEQGRDEDGNYSRTSTGAVDDTTGWRALETNWLCLASLVSAMGERYVDTFELKDALLKDCEFSSVTHVNRHVRAAAMQCLEQWVRGIAKAAASVEEEVDSTKKKKTYLTQSQLRTTVISVLKAGLADNWSQVRMAASVLCRVWFEALKEAAVAPEFATEDKVMMSALLPRMCLNRFYLAQGVKLYSHTTWHLVFAERGTGLDAVAANLPAINRYYVKMCDADNHVVREAACQAIAELAVRLGESSKYHEPMEGHVEMLLQALLMCFHDESWPVRDEACLACGILCKAYPESCRSEFKTLWERWTEQLTDQIWSVREDAAVALGDALEAYGEEVLDKLRVLIQKILPAAREQKAMTAAEYKAHVNDMKQHENAQLYSCGSLAPKLRKGGAGRIGCSNCGIDRPKAPWEATDGCIYLLREMILRGTAENTKTPLTDDELVPLLKELADVCRVQHFPQSDDLRATLWKNVPTMAHALGKQRFKRYYLDIFTDLLFSNLESRTASQLSHHAAGQCAEELSSLVGPAIFRGRLEDYQRDVFDRVMQERQSMPKGPGAGDVFSPFGPPGLLDAVHQQH